MEIKTILVGYDGSDQARRAVDVALDLASPLHADVLVVSVARPPEPSISIELHAVLDDAREHFEEMFKDLRKMAQEKGLQIRTEVVVGHPAEQLIHRAEGAAAGLIVVGRKGTSRFERLLLGSTSERVINFAHCPVVIVK